MIGGVYGTTLIYDVTDPVHPRLQCRMLNAPAHLSGGNAFMYLDPRSADRTNIVLHWFADGNEGPAGVLPAVTTKGAWTPDGTLSAYTVRLEPAGDNPAGSMQVWQYVQGTSLLIGTYRIGIAGCIGCRFGLPQPVLAMSPDGQYLVAGWLSGKGSEPLAVYRLSDRTRVITFDQAATAFWDRSGHRLFVNGLASDGAGGFVADPAQVWTPEAGLTSLVGAGAWSFLAGLSPDGGQIVYTASADAKYSNFRVYVYEQKSATTRMLIDKLRTQALFVRNGWIWYLEEVVCGPSTSTCGPWGTRPTGKVFALQLSTGTETEVSFGVGENPVMQTTEVNWLPFTPGEFWPAG
ncbi:MAG TPA: hypothetical protein VFH00_06010 [Candidatus Nitrosotalea sp.]|nr:hypothetical protein [Candidatus Nitrosotalea sp.]